jgi:hypothetical protein
MLPEDLIPKDRDLTRDEALRVAAALVGEYELMITFSKDTAPTTFGPDVDRRAAEVRAVYQAWLDRVDAVKARLKATGLNSQDPEELRPLVIAYVSMKGVLRRDLDALRKVPKNQKYYTGEEVRRELGLPHSRRSA